MQRKRPDALYARIRDRIKTSNLLNVYQLRTIIRHLRTLAPQPYSWTFPGRKYCRLPNFGRFEQDHEHMWYFHFRI